MSSRRIFCEGPDDLSALREYIRQRYRLKPRSGGPANRVVLVDDEQDIELTIVVAGTRDKVVSEARQFTLVDGSPSTPVVSVGLCFDPDGQDELGWRGWIERAFASDGVVPGKDSWKVRGLAGDVELIPMPWEVAERVHEALDEKQVSERVAARILAATYPPRAALVERWLADVKTLDLEVNWKVAMRLWNALVDSDVSGRAFFDKVFGQNHDLRGELEQVMARSRVGLALARLCTRV